MRQRGEVDAALGVDLDIQRGLDHAQHRKHRGAPEQGTPFQIRFELCCAEHRPAGGVFDGDIPGIDRQGERIERECSQAHAVPGGLQRVGRFALDQVRYEQEAGQQVKGGQGGQDGGQQGAKIGGKFPGENGGH